MTRVSSGVGGTVILSPFRKRELLNQARAFLNKEASEITRSEWRYLVDAIYLSGESRPVEHTRDVLEVLPQSWLKGRSNQLPARLRQLKETFRRIRGLKLEGEELRFLLGWMDRFLRIRDDERRRSERLGQANVR